MKYIKKYEENIFYNSKYKRYIITKVKSFNSSDVYINLYENLYHTMNKNSFRALYYFDHTYNQIEEYFNRQEMDYIAVNNIVYQSDDLSDAIDTLKTIILAKKYNIV